MNDAGACAKGVQGWLEQLDAAAVTAEEGKRGLLEAHQQLADHRAFKDESGGDAAVQDAFRKMGDYCDYYDCDQFTMNIYYKCLPPKKLERSWSWAFESAEHGR